MNWSQFKDPCASLTMWVTPWSLTKKVEGFNNSFNYKYFLLNSANSMKTFKENSIVSQKKYPADSLSVGIHINI